MDGNTVEEELRRKNRALTALSQCNQALLRARDETTFINELCDILVRLGGYRFAWVGYRMDDADKTVRPVGHSGKEDGYLADLRISWADGPLGQGPTGTAIRTGEVVVCRNILSDPRYQPWRRQAKERGYASSIALPLRNDEGCFGALNLYAEAPDAFDDHETALLRELAEDLAYGITALRTRRHLVESEQRYRLLVETANDAILLADAASGRIIDANPAAEALLGVPRAEIIGMHQSEIHPPEERERYRKIFREHTEHGKVIAEDLVILRRDGRRVPGQVSANAFRLRGQRGGQGIFRDVSKIRQAQEQLRQAQKLEAIGTLAGGIAHDFNNLLTPILGYTELAMLRLPEDHPARQDLAEVRAAAGRAKELVRQILTFSRRGRPEPRPLLLQPLVKESVKFLRSSLPSSIEIQVEIDPDCGPVFCDPTEAQQVLLNLCTNAYHAMRQSGGVVEIHLTRVVDARGAWACLTVCDTGVGIPAEMIDRIFEPYFSTKPQGEGTGLGLAVVHGIVSNYGGRIEVRSEQGMGTIMSVYLPEAKGQVVAAVAAADDAPRGSGRILLVDDDERVADVFNRMLEGLGYEVTVRLTSLSALQTFQAATERFDLVLTDYTLPEMTGLELAQRLREERPEIPILLCTGRESEALKQEAERIGVRAVLGKPVGRRELAVAVAAALATS